MADLMKTVVVKQFEVVMSAGGILMLYVLDDRGKLWARQPSGEWVEIKLPEIKL